MAVLILLLSAASLAAAYRLYGGFLARTFGLDDSNPVPSRRMRDGIDFVPTPAPVVLGHHFSSIAGAGPVVGPIIAGLSFGWAPTLLWLLLGCVFIGGAHDLGSMIASIRYRARSIPEICRTYVSPRAFRLFLAFIWLALLYVIVVFLDLTAKTFAEDAGVALSSGLILVLAVAFALGLQRGLSLGAGTAAALAGLALALWAGVERGVVEDVGALLSFGRAAKALGGPQNLHRGLLLVYCVLASVLPVWLVLQPRDYISSFLLYATIAGGVLGLLLGASEVRLDYPAWIGWRSEMNAAPGLLFPVLFITVACGACSGFHCIVASGTTSKQIARETDALRIGYGAMLIEGLLGVLSLLAAVSLGAAALTPAGQVRNPVAVYGDGMAGFLAHLGVPAAAGRHLALLALSTFLLTTLDTCTRLARFALEEFFGLDRARAAVRWGATLASVVPPAVLVFTPFRNAAGETIAAWQAIWPVFGATNQLLAGLALLAVSIWLRRTGRNHLVTTVPMIFMITMTVTALLQIAWANGPASLVGGIASLLLALAILLVVEAVRAFGLGPVDEAALLRTEGTASIPEPAA